LLSFGEKSRSDDPRVRPVFCVAQEICTLLDEIREVCGALNAELSEERERERDTALKFPNDITAFVAKWTSVGVVGPAGRDDNLGRGKFLEMFELLQRLNELFIQSDGYFKDL
jgi:hypothetical protein